MSARDELAMTLLHHPWLPDHEGLYTGLCPECPGRSITGGHNSPSHADHLADALLAAGYRKPRTITTEEELDALPNGSVVLSDVYKAHHGQAISFQRWEDGLWHRGARSGSTHPDNFLPVTVLHEPSGE